MGGYSNKKKNKKVKIKKTFLESFLRFALPIKKIVTCTYKQAPIDVIIIQTLK